MTITKKDLVYLKWLLLFAALYLFWTFLWLPMSNNLDAKRAELANLKIQQQIAQETLPTYQTVIDNEIKAKADASAKFNLFFDVKTPAETEAILIPILTANHGVINFFEVSAAAIVIPQTTLQTKEQLTYKIKELVDAYNHITTPSTELPVTESQLLKTQITYIIDISFTNYQKLLAEIDGMDVSILLSSSQYNLHDQSAEIVFDIYAIEKIILND